MFSNTGTDLNDLGFDPNNIDDYDKVADAIASIYCIKASPEEVAERLKLAEKVGLSDEQMQALATVWAASYIASVEDDKELNDDNISEVVDSRYSDIDSIVSKYTNKDIVIGYMAGISTVTEGEGAGTVDAAQLKSDEAIGQLSSTIMNALDYSELGAVCAAYNGISDIDMINNKAVVDKVASLASNDVNVNRLFGSSELIKTIGIKVLKALEDAKAANVRDGANNIYNISISLMGGIMPQIYSERADAIRPYMDKVIAHAKEYSKEDTINVSDFVDSDKAKAFGIIIDMYKGYTIRKSDIDLFDRVLKIIYKDSISSIMSNYKNGVKESDNIRGRLLDIMGDINLRDLVISDFYSDSAKTDIMLSSVLKSDNEDEYNGIVAYWTGIVTGEVTAPKKDKKPISSEDDRDVAKNKAGFANNHDNDNIIVDELQVGRIRDINIEDSISEMVDGAAHDQAVAEDLATFLSKVAIFNTSSGITSSGSKLITIDGIGKEIVSWMYGSGSDTVLATVIKKYTNRVDSNGVIDEGGAYRYIVDMFTSGNTKFGPGLGSLYKKAKSMSRIEYQDLYNAIIKDVMFDENGDNYDIDYIKPDLISLAKAVSEYAIPSSSSPLSGVDDKVAATVAFSYGCRKYAEKLNGNPAISVEAHLLKWVKGDNVSQYVDTGKVHEVYIKDILSYNRDTTVSRVESSIKKQVVTMVDIGPVVCRVMPSKGTLQKVVGDGGIEEYVLGVTKYDLKVGVSKFMEAMSVSVYGSQKPSYYEARVRLSDTGIELVPFVNKESSSLMIAPRAYGVKSISIIIPKLQGDTDGTLIDAIISDNDSRLPLAPRTENAGNSSGFSISGSEEKSRKMYLLDEIKDMNYSLIKGSISKGSLSVDRPSLYSNRSKLAEARSDAEQQELQKWVAGRKDDVERRVLLRYMQGVYKNVDEDTSISDSIRLDSDIHKDKVIRILSLAAQSVVSKMYGRPETQDDVKKANNKVNAILSYIITYRPDVLSMEEFKGVNNLPPDTARNTIRKDYAKDIKNIFGISNPANYNGWIDKSADLRAAMGDMVSEEVASAMSRNRSGAMRADDRNRGALNIAAYDIYKRGLDPVHVGNAVRDRLEAIRKNITDSGIYSYIEDPNERRSTENAAAYGNMTNEDRAAMMMAMNVKAAAGASDVQKAAEDMGLVANEKTLDDIVGYVTNKGLIQKVKDHLGISK